MNEEEIRGNLLIPYLRDLGFDPSEISLEQSFSVRLGKALRPIHGRADILCKRNGKNLFIIELKNDSINISQEDIDQGISYARLLSGNIAPFTIITNGKSTRIFDSITAEELTDTSIAKQSSFWQSGCTLSTEADLSIRYEALKKFISFSPENLRLFCQEQVKGRMATIIGDVNRPHAKFIQQLYVRRKGLENEFNRFMHSDATVFGLVGEAGVGKTNAVCALALHELKVHFVFFYNATVINKSPVEHIAEDLNIFFSGKTDSDVVLKKLDELGTFLNRQIIIFIDAIDESTNAHLFLDVSEMALSISRLRHIKLCISCKSSLWSTLLIRNSIPTYLFEELQKFHPLISNDDHCPGFLLEKFSDQEAKDIIPLYKEVFGFQGEISPSIAQALRNGFFLRIFSEVYQHRPIPETVNDKQLIHAYLAQSLDKTALKYVKGIRILSKIGEVLLQHTYDSWAAHHDSGIAIDDLMDALSLNLTESIPEDLFSRDILVRSTNDESYHVNFYFSKIRDYIICFHSCQLDKLNDHQLYEVQEKFYRNYIGQSAIQFYADNATPQHERVMIEFKKEKALKYVIAYNEFLEKNFKHFKSKFDPYTDGEIGIYLPENLLHKDTYALCRLIDADRPKLQFAKMGDIFSVGHDELFEMGVSVIHGSNHFLLFEDHDQLVKKEVFRQFKKILEKGGLTAYNSDILLLEQVSAIVYYYAKDLQRPDKYEDYYLPRFNLLYPINLQELKKQAYAFRVREYFQRQYHRNAEEKKKLIKEALDSQVEIPLLGIKGGFPPIEELEKIVNILIERGYSVIPEHILPCPDISIQTIKNIFNTDRTLNIPQIRALQFSPAQARRYIESFFTHFDAAYRAFVEDCFPTFKEQLPFYHSGPHEYFIYMPENLAVWGWFGYRSCSVTPAPVHFRPPRQRHDPFPSEDTETLYGFYLDDLLHNDEYPLLQTVEGINTPKVDEFCVLRNWVYRFLKTDMKQLFKKYE